MPIFKDYDYIFRDADYVFRATNYISKVRCCSMNLLESSTVILTAGTEDADHPLYRLYDRGIGRFFKITAAETLTIKIAQGSQIYPCDRLFIPAGHNHDGMLIDISYSDDDASYTPAIQTYQVSGSGQIELNWPLQYRKYLKFTIPNPASIPQFSELFLTSVYDFEENPTFPADDLDDIFNVENDTTSGGQDRFNIHGDPKRQRNYGLRSIEEAQKTNMLALNNAWAGAKPFYLCDHEGTWIYGKLTKRLHLALEDENESGGSYSFNLSFLEVLP